MKSRRFFSAKKLAVFAALAFLAGAYAHWGILPGTTRQAAAETIERLTQKKVVFRKVLYVPFKGLIFYGLNVYQPDGTPLFSAKKISLDIRILPFLKDKKIVVRQITLDSPVYDHFLEKPAPVRPPPVKTEISGQIDVPVAPDSRQTGIQDIAYGPDYFLPENIFLEVIQISGGLVRVHKAPGSGVMENIRSVNLRMGFRRAPVLSVEGYLKLGDDAYAEVDLKGLHNIKTGRFDYDVRAKSSRVPLWLVDYQKDNFLLLKQGRFLLRTRLKSGESGPLTFGGKMDLKSGELILNHKSRYTGQMTIQAVGAFDRPSKRFTAYKGRIGLFGVDLYNVSKKVQRVEKVNGRIEFEPDLLKVLTMQGSYKNVPFDASGEIRSFKALNLNGEIRSHFAMRELKNLLAPEQQALLKNFDIDGACQAVTSVRGSLRKASEIRPGHKLIVQNASMTSKDKKIRITAINGELALDPAGLHLRSVQLVTAGKSYTLEAFVPKTAAAAGHLELRSDSIRLKADYRMQEGRMLIQKGSARASGLEAGFTGFLNNFSRPFVSVRGNLTADLEKIGSLSSAAAAITGPAGIRGKLAGPFTLKGFWNDPLGWDLKIDAGGNPVYFKKNIRLPFFEVQVRMTGGKLNIPYFHARPYGGLLGGKAVFDLRGPKVPFDAKLYANSVDLAAVSRSLAPQKKISGDLLFQASVRGFLKTPESYVGNGTISLTNGELWETSQFEKMGRLPFVRVEGMDVVLFKKMNAAFQIHDKKFWTRGMSLTSDTVDLSLDGTLDFDRQLDLVMNIRYSDNVMDGAYDTGGLAPMMVQSAENFISKYRVTGALDKPKYEKTLP